MPVAVWLIAAVALAVLEVFSLDLVLIMLAAGALGGAAAAALGAPVAVQAGVAAGVALLGLAAVRPIAIRHLKKSPEALTGVDALIGKKVVVLVRLDGDDGRVKLAGDTWSARMEDTWDPLDVGETGTVVSIEGATAIIRPY